MMKAHWKYTLVITGPLMPPQRTCVQLALNLLVFLQHQFMILHNKKKRSTYMITSVRAKRIINMIWRAYQQHTHNNQHALSMWYSVWMKNKCPLQWAYKFIYVITIILWMMIKMKAKHNMSYSTSNQIQRLDITTNLTTQQKLHLQHSSHFGTHYIKTYIKLTLYEVGTGRDHRCNNQSFQITPTYHKLHKYDHIYHKNGSIKTTRPCLRHECWTRMVSHTSLPPGSNPLPTSGRLRFYQGRPPPRSKTQIVYTTPPPPPPIIWFPYPPSFGSHTPIIWLQRSDHFVFNSRPPNHLFPNSHHFPPFGLHTPIMSLP